MVNTNPTTTLTIYTPSSSSYADVQVFFVMGERMVAKAYANPPGSNKYQVPNVPIGIKGTVVSWCVSSGHILYYYRYDYGATNPVATPVITSGQTMTISYSQETSVDSVLYFIRTLDKSNGGPY